MLKAVFIDLDDTVIDTKKTYDDARIAAFAILEHNYAPFSFSFKDYRAFTIARNSELRQYEDDASLRTPQSLVDAALHFIPSLSEDDQKRIRTIGRNIFTTIGPMKVGVESALLKLSQSAHENGVQLYVLTQGDDAWQNKKMQSLPQHIRDIFDNVFIVPCKSPDMYAHLVEEMRLDPADTIMIGDKEGSDIIPALKAGMNAFFIPAYSNVDFPTIEKQTARFEKRYQAFKNLGDCVRYIQDSILREPPSRTRDLSSSLHL